MIGFPVRVEVLLVSCFLPLFQRAGATQSTAITLQYSLQARTESKFAVRGLVAFPGLAMLSAFFQLDASVKGIHDDSDSILPFFGRVLDLSPIPRCHWQFFATATLSPRRAPADSFFGLSNPGSIRQFPARWSTLDIGILIPAHDDRARSLSSGIGGRPIPIPYLFAPTIPLRPSILPCLLCFVAGRRLRCIRWPKRSNRFDGSRRVPGRCRRENIRERAQGRASTGR